MILARLLSIGLALLLLAALPATASAEPCRNEDFRGASYIVCSFDPAKEDVRIVWRKVDGQPYRLSFIHI